MENTKYIFVGPAGSGKSTMIHQIIKDSKLKFYDILEIMMPYVKKYGSVTNKNKDILDKVVSEFIDSFKDKEFDIIEFASGCYLPQIIEGLKDKKIIVIYCSCLKDISKERMKMRGRVIDEDHLEFQYQFDENYYQKLKAKYDFELVIINSQEDLEKNISKLKKIIY